MPSQEQPQPQKKRQYQLRPSPTPAGQQRSGTTTSRLTDESLMPFGEHKHKAMTDVPANYLLWLRRVGCRHPGVAAYIEENLAALTGEDPDTILD